MTYTIIRPEVEHVFYVTPGGMPVVSEVGENVPSPLITDDWFRFGHLSFAWNSYTKLTKNYWRANRKRRAAQWAPARNFFRKAKLWTVAVFNFLSGGW